MMQCATATATLQFGSAENTNPKFGWLVVFWWECDLGAE
jgi:hypothetical protein